MERDLVFCHPRWPEEEKYLRSELAQIRSYQRTYFRDPWNIFEWLTYAVILTLVMTRILSLASENQTAQSIHPRVYALGLVIIWLRFMRSCRAFRSLGPFIAILKSVIADTMKFAFLFFEFFIPYTVGFWILFGGKSNGKIMGEDSAKHWEKFQDLTFSVWSMTLMGSFDWDGLVAIDRIMAQILCGTYFAVAGVICMNLYIALLSDTFARVYASAQANAVMQQAKTIINLQQRLSKFHRSVFGYYMQDYCCPQEVYARDDSGASDDHEQDMLDRVCRQITNRIDELDESMKRRPSDIIPPHSKSSQLKEEPRNDLENFIQEQKRHNNEMRSEMNSINHAIADIKWILNAREKLGARGNVDSSTENSYLQKSATFSGRGKKGITPSNNPSQRKMVSQSPSMLQNRQHPILSDQSIDRNSFRQREQALFGQQTPSSPHEQMEISRGIHDIQHRLPDLRNTETNNVHNNFSVRPQPVNEPLNSIYPKLSIGNGDTSLRTTPKRRRRRKKKGGTESELSLMTQGDESDTFLDEPSDICTLEQPV